jgi:hypothetical protein
MTHLASNTQNLGPNKLAFDENVAYEDDAPSYKCVSSYCKE